MNDKYRKELIKKLRAKIAFLERELNLLGSENIRLKKENEILELVLQSNSLDMDE